MKKIRILIADDHTILRMGLAGLLSNESDLTVVGEAANGEEAVTLARERKPDVVIMDLMMPVLSGAEATRAIRTENPDTRIVVLTSFADSAELAEAVRAGASATVLKDVETEELVAVIRKVASGGTAIPSSILELTREDDERGELTARQAEVLDGVTRGLANADIARMLGISEIAVKKHLSHVFAKLGASTRTEAVAIALRRHLLKT